MIETFTFNYSGAIQTWVVPYDGIYEIEAYGAQGGNVGKESPYLHEGGNGAYISGEFNLKAGNILYILVGGTGVSKAWNDWGGGGGGGTYVTVSTSTTTYKLLGGFNQYVTPLMAAAGGGGAGDDGCYTVGNGQTLPGYGGVGRSTTTAEGSGGGSSSGSGAGFVTNGICTRMTPAFSFTNGGNAGLSGYNGYNGGFGGGGQPYDGGGGGGGWYGGESPSNNTGMGGYSYNAGLNPQGIDGLQSGNGQVAINLLYGAYAFFFQKDDKYYLPIARYFDTSTKMFETVSLNDLKSEIDNNNYENISLYNINTPFVIDSITYNPLDYLDISKYKICVIPNGSKSNENLAALNIDYIPSSIALSKTNIKIKNKYTPISDELEHTFLDIASDDKFEFSYFLDYGESKSYKQCTELNKEIINSDFYANFMLDTPNALLSSVTLYGKNNDKYNKIKSYNIEVYEDLHKNRLVTFENSYDEIIVNRITKESFDYTIDTLDTF